MIVKGFPQRKWESEFWHGQTGSRRFSKRIQIMDWITVVLACAVAGVFFGLKRMSFVAGEEARRHLKNGAVVIDVRSSEEFASGAVPGAVNLPLGELKERISKQVSDRDKIILVHCLSGGRSAIACQQLKRLGYGKVYNLGSLGRARSIVAGDSQAG